MTRWMTWYLENSSQIPKCTTLSPSFTFDSLFAFSPNPFCKKGKIHGGKVWGMSPKGKMIERLSAGNDFPSWYLMYFIDRVIYLGKACIHSYLSKIDWSELSKPKAIGKEIQKIGENQWIKFIIDFCWYPVDSSSDFSIM